MTAPQEQTTKSIFYSPIWQMTLNRVREFYREPAAVFWVYGFPLLMAVALGIAFRNQPVEEIPVDVQKDSNSTDSQIKAVTKALAQDKRIKLQVVEKQEALRRLQRGKTDLIVVLKPKTKEGPDYEFWTEPTRPSSTLARSAVENAFARARNPDSAFKIAEQTIESPGGRYIDFLIPGLLGMNLMGGGLWGVGFVIVDLRVRKLLKRFLATPMRKHDFMISLMLSRLLFTIPDVLILLGFGYLLFGVGIAGNMALLLFVILLGGICFAGIGLLVACRVKTVESVSGLMNLVMLPMFVLSGVFFSAERFPQVVQPIIQLLPLTALNDALRAIMLDGVMLNAEGLMILGPDLAIMAVWGAVSFVGALVLFRWG